MRVLHVHKIAGIGGSERHLLALLPALRADGVDARFLGLDVPRSDAPSFYRELQASGVPASHVVCGSDVSPRLGRDVLRAVQAAAADLLHTHLVHADVYGATAAAALRLPHVSTRHNDDRYLLGPFRHVDRAFAARTVRLVAISHAVRRFLVTAGHPARKIETIYYGLDRLPPTRSEPTPAQAGVPAAAPLLLAVGRLAPQKDHATLLRAFAMLRTRRRDARLAILGDGPLEGETRLLVRRLGVDGAVFMPGRVAVRDWLERADVFVHTSRWEGFGMALLEAMLARLPVVATGASAVNEVVADGRTGLLVAPGDASALSSALERLLAEPRLAASLGVAGLDRARRRFSVDEMSARIVALYESL